MQVQPLSLTLISFGSYQSPLKTLFKKGKFPSVKKGIYGDALTPENASLEHLKPKSKGGINHLKNYALASTDSNSKRGNKPLEEFLTGEMLDEYLEQFNFKIPGKFDGYEYQDMIRRTCSELGVTGKEPPKPESINYGSLKEVLQNLDKIDITQLPKKILKSLRKKFRKENKELNLFA